MSGPTQSRAFYLPLGQRGTRQRPSWWDAPTVLDRLRNGEAPAALCRRASDELGGVIAPTTLRSDISKWGATASLGEQFAAALALYKRLPATGAVVLSTDWHDEFFAALEDAAGVIEDACNVSCVGPEVVYALCDERNECYDAKFAERVRIAEGARLAEVRANVLNQAAEATVDGAKLGLKVLESGMPTLHGAKSKLTVVGKVEVEHGLAREVVEASAARTRALMAGRQGTSGANTSANVIDVTPTKAALK